MLVERWNHLLWLLVKVRAEHVNSELNSIENLSFQFSWFRVTTLLRDIFAIKSIFVPTSNSIPPVISHWKCPRLQETSKGWKDQWIFPAALLWLQTDLANFHHILELAFLGWNSHILRVTFLICSSKSHSADQCPEEKSSSRCRTSHSYFPYLAFICWRDGFWIRCIYLFPNHWVSLLLTPLFEEPFSWCFSADVFPIQLVLNMHQCCFFLKLIVFQFSIVSNIF